MERVKLVSYEKLEEENQELRTVLRKLSHEMGNALTLLGASIFYVETDIEKLNVKCDLMELKNDYSYICNLFGELREYNHTEGINKKEVTVSDMMIAIENAFFRLTGNENILLVTNRQINDQKTRIFADKIKLRQALINVIKNSIDAVKDNDDIKGKKIEISVMMESVADKEFWGQNFYYKNEVVHIEIKDNGKGISEHHIDKIFQPMFTYGKGDGTGLGLSVVKKIVEDHGGKIKAVSALGTGTAIHIYLPILN